MPIVHTYTDVVAAKNTDGTALGNLSGSHTEVGNTEIVLDVYQAASSTDTLVACAFTAANVQGFEIVASVDMTLETNSSSSPANTFSLKAGRPFTWSKSAAYYTNPFTSNVTAFYLTNTSAGTFKARILTS